MAAFLERALGEAEVHMLPAMGDYESSESRVHLNPPGFCIIPGCTSPSETSRRVLLGDDRDREIEVCWKHAEGELDPEWISELGD